MQTKTWSALLVGISLSYTFCHLPLFTVFGNFRVP